MTAAGMHKDDNLSSTADKSAVTVGRRRKTALCGECGIYPADPPSRLCPGCEAYQEHRT